MPANVAVSTSFKGVAVIDVSPLSSGNKFRRSRVKLLRRLIERTLETKQSCAVLDVGGTYAFWHVWRDEIDWTRTEITCVNLNPIHHSEIGRDNTRVRMVEGDACDLREIADNSFDVTFSNSVIEHVGPWRRMKAMAAEVKRVAPRFLVQTPNYWFPIEPHARTLVLHWLPEPWAYRIVMRRQCGFWAKQETVADAVEAVQSARLLDKRQVEALFDDATVICERFFGLTKSLIAIRGVVTAVVNRHFLAASRERNLAAHRR